MPSSVILISHPENKNVFLNIYFKVSIFSREIQNGTGNSYLEAKVPRLFVFLGFEDRPIAWYGFCDWQNKLDR